MCSSIFAEQITIMTEMTENLFASTFICIQ